MPSYLDDYPQQSNLPQGRTQDQMTPLQSRVATEVTPTQPVQLILPKVKNNDYIGKFGDAFRQARQSGSSEFFWTDNKGVKRKYTTDLVGESQKASTTQPVQKSKTTQPKATQKPAAKQQSEKSTKQKSAKQEEQPKTGSDYQAVSNILQEHLKNNPQQAAAPVQTQTKTQAKPASKVTYGWNPAGTTPTYGGALDAITTGAKNAFMRVSRFGADRIEDVVNTFSNMSQRADQRGAEEAKKRNAINQAREEERQRRIKELEAKKPQQVKAQQDRVNEHRQKVKTFYGI